MTTPKFKLAPPDITVAPVTGDTEMLSAVADVDMVVVPKVAGQGLSSFAQILDEATGGLIRREANLVGNAGTQLLIDLKSHGKRLGKLHRILVLGIGTADEYHAKRACAVTEAMMEKAVVFRARKIALLVAPNRLTESNMTLSGIAAVTRCRLGVFASDCKACMPNELRLVCSPQAAHHLERGLAVESPRCSFCTSPTL
jgi:hypothetical protein